MRFIELLAGVCVLVMLGSLFFWFFWRLLTHKKPVDAAIEAAQQASESVDAAKGANEKEIARLVEQNKRAKRFQNS